MLSGVKLGGGGVGWGVGGGDRGREEEEIGVESKRGKERNGICVHRELSKDSRAHLWSAERLFTDFTTCTASTPTPAARLSKVARRSSREHIN